MVTGRKLAYLEAIELIAQHWRRGPAIFLGDTNCGRPVIDEERPVFGAVTRRWLDSMVANGWVDAFRHLDAETRFFTWYSPNGGNGFRLDQALINRRMRPWLRNAWYEWGVLEGSASRTALSDHAALLLDLEPAPINPGSLLSRESRRHLR
jgi:exonuclease III